MHRISTAMKAAASSAAASATAAATAVTATAANSAPALPSEVPPSPHPSSPNPELSTMMQQSLPPPLMMMQLCGCVEAAALAASACPTMLTLMELGGNISGSGEVLYQNALSKRCVERARVREGVCRCRGEIGIRAEGRVCGRNEENECDI